MHGGSGMGSRLTFRSAQTDTAWQRQLRDKYNDEGVPDVPHLDVKRAIVRPVSYQLAKQIILKYEWLGAMSNTSYHYGLFFGRYCAGVCCVGTSAASGGANNHLFYGVTSQELLILARGACVHWSPQGANSKLVSWTCRLLAKEKRGKLVVAYSDTDAGEIGTIYQACNWTYIGRGASTKQWIAPNGRVYDQKQPSNIRETQGKRRPRSHYVQAMLEAGWVQQDSNPKHRYAYILDTQDTALVDRIERLRQPYPKR